MFVNDIFEGEIYWFFFFAHRHFVLTTCPFTLFPSLSCFAVTFISWFDFRMLFFLSIYYISAKFLRAHIRDCVPVCYACSNVDIIYIFPFFPLSKNGAHMRAKDRASLPKHTLFWNVIGITLTTRTYGYNRVAASCFQRFANVVFSSQNRCTRNMRYDRFIDANRCDNRIECFVCTRMKRKSRWPLLVGNHSAFSLW